MSVRAAALANRALQTRQRIVLVHVAAVRGLDGPPVGLHAVFTPESGLSETLGNPGLDRQVSRHAGEALARGEPCVQMHAADGAAVTRRDRAYLRVFYDPVVPVPRLLIIGAGHIAQPTTTFGAGVGFEVWVVDDRADYANRERFPSAAQVVAQPIGAFLDNFPVDDSTYVVLVTRAHRFDEDALRRLLGTPAPYIGMIGSRRRVHIVYKTLLQEGAAPEAFRKVFAPIGLDIGAQSPEEIGLAIVAEIVNLRRGGCATHLSLSDFREAPSKARTA